MGYPAISGGQELTVIWAGIPARSLGGLTHYRSIHEPAPPGKEKRGGLVFLALWFMQCNSILKPV